MNDPILSTIISNIIDRIPVISIILIGGRAKGVTDAYSDYDIVVVANVVMIPVYFKTLKKINEDIALNYDIDLSLSFFPKFKFNHANGDLFMYKLITEGVIIYGNNLLSYDARIKINYFKIDWYFSLLFSLMKDLLLCHPPNNRILRTNKKIGNTLLDFSNIIDGNLSKIIRTYALDILAHDPESRNLWFETRNSCINLFKVYVSFFSNNIFIFNQLGITNYYEINKEKNILKNFEFILLTILYERKIPPLNLVFSKAIIQDRIRMSLLFLLASVEENKINEQLITLSYQNFHKYYDVFCYSNRMDIWGKLKNVLLLKWKRFHPIIGL